jgi:hypothetical protein
MHGLSGGESVGSLGDRSNSISALAAATIAAMLLPSSARRRATFA